MNAFAEDTKAQIPVGIAVGPNQTIEISFDDMTNTQGCNFNGAYVVDPTVDAETRKSMLSLFLASKVAAIPVQVRLHGCSDRPRFHYVFLDVNWI